MPARPLPVDEPVSETSPDACLRLLSMLTLVADANDESRVLKMLVEPTRPFILSFLNQHGLNLAWEDREFRDALMQSDVILRDGIGLSFCMAILGRQAGFNMNGTDLIPRITDLYAGRRVMLIGTVSPYLEQAADILSVRRCQVVGTLNGFLPEEAYIEAIRRQKPDLVILGMGMPKQEKVAALLARSVSHPMLIVNGGAIIDFLGERVQRAPGWVRSIRMEWFYRLLHEPRRMFGRYIIGGVTFLHKTIQLRRASRSG